MILFWCCSCAILCFRLNQNNNYFRAKIHTQTCTYNRQEFTAKKINFMFVRKTCFHQKLFSFGFFFFFLLLVSGIVYVISKIQTNIHELRLLYLLKFYFTFTINSGVVGGWKQNSYYHITSITLQQQLKQFGEVFKLKIKKQALKSAGDWMIDSLQRVSL